MIKVTEPNDVVWVEHHVIKMHDNPPADSQWEYKVWMPNWLAEWDVFGDWEVERFNSMRDNLKQGDVLFDIGAELGWQSIIYAQMVGPENMVLIEPANDLWPNIMHTWRANFPLVKPLACHYGLISDHTTSDFVLPNHTFPAEAEGALVHQVSYVYIHEHGHRAPQITLDDYVVRSGNIPNALTMDTEGSELLILKGAEATLKAYPLLVWVAVHDELAERDYDIKPGEIHEFMKSCGYYGEFLAQDHEAHWLYRK